MKADKGVASSRYKIVREEIISAADMGEIQVEITDACSGRPIAVRAVVTASDGSHPSGSEYGVYADGHFFAEGHFTVKLPAGCTQILLQSGPDYVPLRIEADAAIHRKLYLGAFLYQWFSPEKRGWYSGDNHVHSQHDTTAQVKTGLAYTALQGRANGLSYITEAGSNVSYEDIDKMSTETFMLRHAEEMKFACYVGHLNTPGINEPISPDKLEAIRKTPLPVQELLKEVHSLGGTVTYSHPLQPQHQLHWMGASEVFSDAALGHCADAFDVDARETELLWYSVLNMGNKLAVSSYTDTCLERINARTPGDRRVYCYAEEFKYESIIEALGRGRTFATNGGPVFAFFKIDEYQPGDTAVLDELHTYICNAEVHSLYPLKKAELIRRGNVVKSFDIAGKEKEITLSHSFREKEKSWYVLRVEDEHGNWCITSPVYFEPHQAAARGFAHAILLEIANHTRFIQLRKDFFAHLIVTVSPDSMLTEVQLLKDGEVIRRFRPDMGNLLPQGKIPVTELEMGGEYEMGWVWYPEKAGKKVHFQGDYPVTESGWYSIRMIADEGIEVVSDAVYYDGKNPYSHELSVAHLSGSDTRFDLWGYGEEMLLDEIREPYEDHWWYPYNTAWQVKAVFNGQVHRVGGGGNTKPDHSEKLPMYFKSSKL